MTRTVLAIILSLLVCGSVYAEDPVNAAACATLVDAGGNPDDGAALECIHNNTAHGGGVGLGGGGGGNGNGCGLAQSSCPAWQCLVQPDCKCGPC